MEKKRMILLILCLCMAVTGGLFFLWKYKAAEFPPEGDRDDKAEYKLKFGHDMPSNSAQHEAAVKFATLVAERTQGHVTIHIYPSQQLGTDYDMIQAARTGEVDIILTPTAKLSTLVPQFQYVDLPFLCFHKEDIYGVLDGESGQRLFDLLSPLGLIGVAFWESGFKQFTADKPIRTPDDFKGLKIRTMKSPIIMDQFKCLGGQAIPIDFHQTYDALKDGVVNGQENPLVSIVNMKFYEQQPHVIISNHGYLGYVCMLSKVSYDTLPSRYRDVLIRTLKETTDFERQRTHEMEETFMNTLKDARVDIYHLSREERLEFKEKTRHLSEKYSPVVGYDVTYETEKYLQEKHESDANDDILIGLDADLTLGSAPSGHAIKRGIDLAMADINRHGGVLGKKLRLVIRDNGGISARGIANMRYFSGLKHLVAVMGGLHSPVALSQLDIIHKEKIIYLDPWAAATTIVDNGYSPNYVFRVSVRDEYAGAFLVDHVLEKYQRPALLLENTGWGRSNFQAMTSAMEEKGMKPVTVEWFNWGEEDMSSQLDSMEEHQADVVLMVANAPEGAMIVKNMASRTTPIPIVSHWGITGGYFFKNVQSYLDKIDLVFLQTFSYKPCGNEKACQLTEIYLDTYNLSYPERIDAPVGVAHAYDLVHLLAAAIRQAGTMDRPRVRDELERLPSYQGVLKRYHPPFTRENHDALNRDDFILSRYDAHGRIVSLETR